MVERACVICDSGFYTSHSRKMTCSVECMKKHKKNLDRRMAVSKSKATYCKVCKVNLKPAGVTGNRSVYCDTCRIMVKKEGDRERIGKYEKTDKGRAARKKANNNTRNKRFYKLGGYSDAYMRHVEVCYVSDLTGVDSVRVGKIRNHVERQIGFRVDKDDLVEFVLHRGLLNAIKNAGN